MLTDIFIRRYESRPLFGAVGQREQALFVQAYRIINEQLFPYYGYDKKVDERSKATWTSLHDRLTMELGLKELSPRFYSYRGEWMGKPHTYSGWYEMNLVCESWLTKQFADGVDPDAFVKRRLSFVELAFRERGQQIDQLNGQLEGELRMAALRDAMPQQGGLRAPGLPQSNVDRVRRNNENLNATFAGHVHELTSASSRRVCRCIITMVLSKSLLIRRYKAGSSSRSGTQ